MEYHPSDSRFDIDSQNSHMQDMDSFSPPIHQLRAPTKASVASEKVGVPRPRPVQVAPGVSCITSLLRKEDSLNASIRRRRMQKWQARSNGQPQTLPPVSVNELPNLEVKAAKKKELAKYFKNFIDVW